MDVKGIANVARELEDLNVAGVVEVADTLEQLSVRLREIVPEAEPSKVTVLRVTANDLGGLVRQLRELQPRHLAEISRRLRQQF